MCQPQVPGLDTTPGYIRGISNEISPKIGTTWQKATLTTGMGNQETRRTVWFNPKTGLYDSKVANLPGARVELGKETKVVHTTNPAWVAEAERRHAAFLAEQQQQAQPVTQASIPPPPPPAPSPPPPPAPPATPAQPEARSRGDARPGSRRTRRVSNAPGTGRSSLVIPVSLGGLTGGAGLSIPR